MTGAPGGGHTTGELGSSPWCVVNAVRPTVGIGEVYGSCCAWRVRRVRVRSCLICAKPSLDPSQSHSSLPLLNSCLLALPAESSAGQLALNDTKDEITVLAGVAARVLSAAARALVGVAGSAVQRDWLSWSSAPEAAGLSSVVCDVGISVGMINPGYGGFFPFRPAWPRLDPVRGKFWWFSGSSGELELD